MGHAVVFICPLFHFACKDNGWELSISTPEEKRAKWHALLPAYLKEGRISHHIHEKLLGRLSFSQTARFGKIARTQLRPTYQEFHRVVFAALHPLTKNRFPADGRKLSRRLPLG